MTHDTRQLAFEAIKKDGRATTLRYLCLREFASSEPMTADELAAKLGEEITTIRPRVSELKSKGAIYDTGARRENSSGKLAKVWAAAE